MYSSTNSRTKAQPPYKATVTSILCNLTKEQRRLFIERTNQAAQKEQRLASMASRAHMALREPQESLEKHSRWTWASFVAYFKQIWH